MSVIIRGGCIRLYPDGPALHVNSAHATADVASVHIGPDDGYLWVVHAVTAPVVAILCSPDETLTGRGIDAGGSGGTSHTRVRFTQQTADGPVPLDLRDPVDYAKVAGTGSNLWYAVVHTAPDVPVLAPAMAELKRVVQLLERGAGWSFDDLTMAHASFDAVRDAHRDFHAVAVPR